MREEIMKRLKKYGIETEEELMKAVEGLSIDISMFAEEGIHYIYKEHT